MSFQSKNLLSFSALSWQTEHIDIFHKCKIRNLGNNNEVINIASIYSSFNSFFERNEITLPVSLTIWLIKKDGRVSSSKCESFLSVSSITDGR